MPLRALLRRPLRWQWRPLRWQWRLAPPRCRAAFQSQANNSDARVPPSLSMSGALSRLSSSQHPPTQDQTHSFSPSPPTRASARAAACCPCLRAPLLSGLLDEAAPDNGRPLSKDAAVGRGQPLRSHARAKVGRAAARGRVAGRPIAATPAGSRGAEKRTG